MKSKIMMFEFWQGFCVTLLHAWPGFVALLCLGLALKAHSQGQVSDFGQPFGESIQFDFLKGGDPAECYLQITRDPGATRPVFLEISFANISRGLEYKKLKVRQAQLANPTTLVELTGFNKDDLYTLRVTLGYAKRSGKIVEGKDFFPGTRKTADRVPQFCLADLYSTPAPAMSRETPVPLDGPKPVSPDEDFGERKKFTPPPAEFPILSPEVPAKNYDYEDTTGTSFTPRTVYFDQDGFEEYQKQNSINIDSTTEPGTWIVSEIGDSCDYSLSGGITTNSNGAATIEFSVTGVKEGNFFYTTSKFMPDGVIADLQTPKERFFPGGETSYSAQVELPKLPATLYLRIKFFCGFEDTIVLNATLPKKE